MMTKITARLLKELKPAKIRYDVRYAHLAPAHKQLAVKQLQRRRDAILDGNIIL